MSLILASDTRAHATMLRQFTYAIDWLPERHYVPGTDIEVRSHCLRAFLGWRYTRLEIEHADVYYRWKVAPSVSEMQTNKTRTIARARLRYGVRRGERCRIHLTAIPPIWAGIDQDLSVWIVDYPRLHPTDAPPPEAVAEAGSTCILPVEAGPVARLSVISRPMPGPGGAVRTMLVPEDRFGNPSALKAPVAVGLRWCGKEWTQHVQETTQVSLPAPESVARLEVRVPMDGLDASENVANASREGERLLVTGNPVWPEPGEGAERAAFGEFHWHTELSGDGQRPIRTALRCARDAMNMDFAAPGDHSPAGAKWTETVAALEEFDAPGEFATFFGWEASSDRGHENYYFTDPDHPLRPGGEATGARGPADTRVAALEDIPDFIAIPHHTNAVAESRRLEDDAPYWHAYPWPETPPRYMPLVEIFQARGNQERNVYEDAWRGWHQNNGASAQDALALGYRIGFTGGTDNHCGWPGRAYAQCEAPGVHSPKSVILTGVWAADVARQAVYDALAARRTWAAWDTRAIVRFSVNGELMGGEVTAREGEALSARIVMSAEDAFQSVEIVSERRAVWTGTFHTTDVEAQVALGPAERDTHFYLRALLRSGGLVYASPVFLRVTA